MILVTGGTGFLGGHVLEALYAAKQPVRVLAMGGGDWRSDSLSRLKQMHIDAVVGSILDARLVSQAVEGCTVIINAAGGLSRRSDADWRHVHVEGLKVLVEEAQKKGVQRFVQVSCLGAAEQSDCEYFRLKWQGEQIVRNGQFYWTIFRPSYMFGERCQLVSLLAPLMKLPLATPVIGSGLNEIQPVWVEEVASCILQSIYKKEAANQVCDLVGPKTYTMLQFMELLRSESGSGKPVVAVPVTAVLKMLKPVGRLVPGLPLDAEFLKLLVCDSCSRSQLMHQLFKVRGVPIDEFLPRILADA